MLFRSTCSLNQAKLRVREFLFNTVNMLTDYVFVCIVHQNQGTLLLHFNWNPKTIFADPRIVYTVGILIRDLFSIHMAKVCCVRV